MGGPSSPRPLRAAALWTLAAALLLLAPLPTLLRDLAGATRGSLPLDKAAHAALFALVGWAWLRATKPATSLAAAGVAAAVIAFGGLVELAQPLVATRRAEWSDLAADGLGVGLALALARSRRAAAL